MPLCAVCLATLSTATSAQADVSVSIVPQTPMVAPQDQSYEQGRTDQRDVTLLIEGSWSELDCEFDGTPTSCGTPVTPCPAAQCVAFTRTDLRGGNDGLSVDASDPDSGDADALYRFYVDVKPPFTYVDSASGTPTRPAFEVGYNEDDEYADDTFQCSFTPADALPVWSLCPESGEFMPAVPPRHIDYLLRVRTTDDLGRSTEVTVPYDPEPCTLGRLRSMRPLPFEVYGVPYDLHCAAGTQGVELDLYLLGENGHRHSLAWAMRHHQEFGTSFLTHRLTRHGRQLLEPDDSLDIQLKRDRSARLALVAVPMVGPRYGPLTGIPAIRYFTLHH